MKYIFLSALMLMPSFGFADTVYRGMDQKRVLFKSFSQLKQQAYLTQKPQISRTEYNDIYQLKKPLTFLNQEVMLLSDEYMSEYIGCCVSEGWGAVFKVQNDYEDLKKYATDNYCSLETIQNPSQEDYYGFAYRKLGKGKLVELSCRARDIQN